MIPSKLLQTLSLSLTLLLSTTQASSSSSSPLFLLASTTTLPLHKDDPRDNAPVSQVQHVLWRSLSKCPTKHYAVVVEPRVLSYPSTSTTTTSSDKDGYVPATPNAKSVYVANDVDGKVNIVHVINTILMDCLHHGVLRVEELDTKKQELPKLHGDVVRKSIMYARMPEVDVGLKREEYGVVMHERRLYTEQVIKQYFDEEDYTLIYIREEAVEGTDDRVVGHVDDGKEIPIVEDH